MILIMVEDAVHASWIFVRKGGVTKSGKLM